MAHDFYSFLKIDIKNNSSGASSLMYQIIFYPLKYIFPTNIKMDFITKPGNNFLFPTVKTPAPSTAICL